MRPLLCGFIKACVHYYPFIGRKRQIGGLPVLSNLEYRPPFIIGGKTLIKGVPFNSNRFIHIVKNTNIVVKVINQKTVRFLIRINIGSRLFRRFCFCKDDGVFGFNDGQFFF